MKIYIFKQDNSFGDRLSLTVTAENIARATNVIKTWILKNTILQDESYKEGFKYMTDFVESERKKIHDFQEEYKNNEDILKHNTLKSQLDHKFWADEDGSYSINDFDNNPSLFDKFASKDAERTYIWAFENEEYEISELNSTEEKVLNSDFIYCGR